MSSMYESLAASLEGEPIREISTRLGMSEADATKGMQAALPLLVSALARNAQQPGGESAIQGALDRDHDGSIFDDIGGLAAGKYEQDGDAILGHMLGGDRAQAEGQMAQFAGLDAQSMGKILAVLAPLIMGWLARRKQGGGGGSGGGLGDILKREEGDARGRGGGGLGDILGDILGGGAGSGGSPAPKSKMPGCLGMLGGLLGKRGR